MNFLEWSFEKIDSIGRESVGDIFHSFPKIQDIRLQVFFLRIHQSKNLDQNKSRILTKGCRKKSVASTSCRKKNLNLHPKDCGKNAKFIKKSRNTEISWKDREKTENLWKDREKIRISSKSREKNTNFVKGPPKIREFLQKAAAKMQIPSKDWGKNANIVKGSLKTGNSVKKNKNDFLEKVLKKCGFGRMAALKTRISSRSRGKNANLVKESHHIFKNFVSYRKEESQF